MIIGKGAKIKGDRHSFGLAGLQLYFGEAFQFFVRAHQPGFLVVDVDLDGLFAGPAPRVGYVDRYGQAVDIFEGGGRDPGIAVGKAGVAQPVAEGEQHRHGLGVVVTVADEEPLCEVRLGEVAAGAHGPRVPRRVDGAAAKPRA